MVAATEILSPVPVAVPERQDDASESSIEYGRNCRQYAFRFRHVVTVGGDMFPMHSIDTYMSIRHLEFVGVPSGPWK
jgi:hypothetical protein